MGKKNMKKVSWEDYEENFKDYKEKYDLCYFVDMENVAALKINLEINESALCDIPEFGVSLMALDEDFNDQVAAWLPDGMFVYLDTDLEEVIESVAEEYSLFFRRDEDELTSQELLYELKGGYTFISNADPAYSSDYPEIDEEIKEAIEDGDFEELDKNSEDFLLYAERMGFVELVAEDDLSREIKDGDLPDRIFRVGDYRIGF